MDNLMLQLLTSQPAKTRRGKLSEFGQMFARTLGIHGDDDRITIGSLDLDFPMHRTVREAAKGVALLVTDEALDWGDDDVGLIVDRNAARGPFAKEPCVSLTHPATAFLITTTHAVTAAHAVAFRNPRTLSLAFGLDTAAALAPDGLSYRLRHSQVVAVKQIVALILDPLLGDIAVLELDDAVSAKIAKPLPIAPARSTAMLQEVAMISHAHAQPLKAIVRPRMLAEEWRYPRILDQDERFIYTNLDSFRGCSGSPVIDTAGRVVGVQFRGESETNAEAVPEAHPEDAAGSAATRIDVIRDTMAALGKPLPLG